MRAVLVLVPLVLALGGAPPEAPPPVPAAEYRLEWDAPAGCPEAAAIEARIAALTPGRPPGVGTLEIHGRVTARSDGYGLALTTRLRGRTDLRELASTECSELAETVALVVAVSLDPSLAVGPLEPEPEPEPTIPPVSTTPVLSAQPPSAVTTPAIGRSVDAPRPPLPRPQALLRAAVGPELGALPGPTAGLRVAVGLGWPRLRLKLAGTYLAPRRAEGPSTAAALYQQGAVALVGCGRWSWGPWSLPACGGLEAGGLRADGRGLRVPRAVVGPWLGPLASVGVVRTMRRLGVWLSLEGVARGAFTRVVIDDQLAFRPAVGSLRLWAGLEFSWPWIRPKPDN